MIKQILILLMMIEFYPCFTQDKLIAFDKDLSTVQYPFEVKFQKLNSQGQDLRMAYLDVQPLDPNGKTVVLLHGKNFNIAYWEQTIRELIKIGFRVIAADQIGFGKSTKPENYQYSFQQLALNTKSILDSLKINKIFLLGHSMGGMIATRFALSYPNMVDRLILENPIGLEDYKVMTSYQSIDENYQSELKNNVESYRNYQLKFYYDNNWKSQYDPWLFLLAGWTLHEDYPIVAWNAAKTTDMIFTQPVVYEFKDIRCPTLIIIGTRDRTAIGKERASKEMQLKMGLYNELGKTTQKAIPNSTLVELENIGHLPHIESFERFILPLIEFINK